MLRRLFTLLSAASLLLCAGSSVLWVLSYRAGGWVVAQTLVAKDDTVVVIASSGYLTVEREFTVYRHLKVREQIPGVELPLEAKAPRPAVGVVGRARYYRVLNMDSSATMKSVNSVDTEQAWVSLALACLASAALAVVCILARLSQRRA